ncbi:MAG: MFS transporter [Myxococcota bacterium]
MTERPDPVADGSRLPEAERARGRRLAVLSHPAGMTHRMAFTDQLPTLALVALGASEGLVGAQRFLVLIAVLLQLPTLRMVGRVPKRHILVSGQVAAVLGSLPLVAFGVLAGLGGPGVALALVGFATTAAGFTVSGTVWFPLLHGYVDPERIGRFFGVLRTGWHLTLIGYFLGARAWLEARPGDFGPIFALAASLGALRAVLVSRLPERSEQTGEAVSVRDAFRFVRKRPGWSSYLTGTVLGGSARTVFMTFAIVMMRRVLGFSEADVLYTTVALFSGGLVSLYLWGRAVDAFGPAPVFRVTALGQAALMLAFTTLAETQVGAVGWAVLVFFGMALLASGFDVADTRVLFGMTPDDTPARLIAPTTVANGLLRGTLPLLAGLALEQGLGAGAAPAEAYRGLFSVLAVLQVAALWPLRRFQQVGRHREH